MSLTDPEARERVAHIESLLERAETIPDVSARDLIIETVQVLLDIYGEGLARMVGHVSEQCRGATQQDIADAFAGDELVSHLLLLHGLHPAGQLSVTPIEQGPALVPLRRARRSAPASSKAEGAEDSALESQTSALTGC